MKKLLNNNLIKNFLILLVFTNILEITFRMINNSLVFDWSYLRIFLGLAFGSLLISFILSWTNKTCSKVLVIFISLIFSIYAFLQLGFNNFIGVYMSFNTSSQLGAVTDYVKEFLASFLPKFYLIFIPFALLIIYYVFLDKFTEMRFKKKFVLKSHIKYEPGIRTISTILVLFVIGFVYNETLTAKFMQNELQTISNEDLFAYPSVPSLVINEFGVIGFGFLDIKSLYVDPPEVYVYDAEDENITFETDRTFDDSLWQELTREETNTALNTINNYLINNTITDYNEYTGLFEGKNLIVIMMESVNEIFINPDLYPNFYKLYSEGISFTNNYSPRNSCSTGNNEFSAMTGLYSIQNNCTANIYRDNTYSTSLFNLFNNAGYKTSSMHDYTEAYYYRSIIHANMGSGRYYGVQDLGIPYYNEYKNWASDEDFMEVAMDITLSDTSTNPFMLWLTTVSSHQPYNQSSVEGDKYLSITEGTDYPDDLRRYMSKLKTLDNALGILLERLSDAGILDDTVIVLFGDHYPYGLSDETINYVLDYDLNDYERERTPMVIYNSEITPMQVDKYTSYVNLTPTIANLFNLDYDPRHYMGSDVLSEDYWNIVTFADGSWKNDYMYYNAATSEVTYYQDITISTEEIRRINQIITLKMQMSSSIIQNNYYEYLDAELERLKSEQETYAEVEETSENIDTNLIGG